MKTILVLAGGSETDAVVFESALAVARPLGAHLEFLHIHVSPSQAAAFTPHVEFAMGGALRQALGRLQAQAEARSAAAVRDFQQFCGREAIGIAEAPGQSREVSAAWREERDSSVEKMIRRARHNDLTVIGRSSRANGLPAALMELLLIGSGRPVLLAPPKLKRNFVRTALVCWKETAPSARALAAALPVLGRAKRVVVIGVEEAAAISSESVRDIAGQLAWHGISAECRWIRANGRSAAEHLKDAARQDEADLLVMGGYGHSRARETIFGGCTQSFIDQAEWPVLMMH